MATFGGNFMSDTLLEIRQKIDKIDQALLDLIRQRLSLSNEIATVKLDGSPVYRPAREALLMHKLLLQIDNDFEKDVVIRLWRLLLASSVHRQKPKFKIISLRGLEKFTQEFSSNFLEHEQCETEKDIIKKLLENDAEIAFFPYSGLSKIGMHLGKKTGIYLNHKIDNVAIICKNMPEETGFDISVFKSSNVLETAIIEKPGFLAENNSKELVYIGAWVNLTSR